MCSQQESTWLWGSVEREVWFGSQPNNFETLGVGVRSPQESVKRRGGGGPQGTKTFKGHRGKEELPMTGGERRTRENREEPVEQNVSVEMVHSVR